MFSSIIPAFIFKRTDDLSLSVLYTTICIEKQPQMKHKSVNRHEDTTLLAAHRVEEIIPSLNPYGLGLW